jgi:hypothetical protein
LERFFPKEKGREPLWLKAFSHFFNTLSDRLVRNGPAFFTIISYVAVTMLFEGFLGAERLGPPWSSDPLKVDESPLHVRAYQLHANPVAYIHPFETTHQSSFNGRIEKPHPRAFKCRTSNDGVEPFADP